MRIDELVPWIAAACHRAARTRDELTTLDAAAGDGDLGVTVASGVLAVADALQELPAGCSADKLMAAAGAAFARGNPSSFAALGGAGLLAAAKALDGRPALERESVVTALEAAADKIAERGRATAGDRTVLDALVPSVQALRDAPLGMRQGLESMVEAARQGAKATKSMTPTRGRAAWVGERARGVPDAGAVAYVRILEALLETLPLRASS